VKTIAKWIAGVFTVALLFLFSIPFYVYVRGISQVEYLYDPPANLQSESVLYEYKRWLGRPSDSDYRRLNPHSYIYHILEQYRNRDPNRDMHSDVKLYQNAARIRYLHDVKGYKANVIESIYISRHWSIDESISEVLNRQYYGNKIFGIEAASEFYFGIPLTELSSDQLFVLFHIPKSPSRFDLWCEMGTFKQSIEAQASRRGMSYELPLLKLRLDIEREC